jgi:hypothetical protein
MVPMDMETDQQHLDLSCRDINESAITTSPLFMYSSPAALAAAAAAISSSSTISLHFLQHSTAVHTSRKVMSPALLMIMSAHDA